MRELLEQHEAETIALLVKVLVLDHAPSPDPHPREAGVLGQLEDLRRAVPLPDAAAEQLVTRDPVTTPQKHRPSVDEDLPSGGVGRDGRRHLRLP